jgi:hypothetical protein
VYGNANTAQAPPLVLAVPASSTVNAYVRVGVYEFGSTQDIDFTVSWSFRGE